jgi:hypothetical protein
MMPVAAFPLLVCGVLPVKFAPVFLLGGYLSCFLFLFRPLLLEAQWRLWHLFAITAWLAMFFAAVGGAMRLVGVRF